MHIEETDTAPLKQWLIKRLEDISDADSDVLADYVLALIKSDEGEDQVRASSIENLEDFLREHTIPFVNDVFNAVRARSFVPGHKITATAINNSNKRAGDGAIVRDVEPTTANQGLKIQDNQSRKRSYHERDGDDTEGRSTHYKMEGVEHAPKQARRANHRGGRQGMAGRHNRGLHSDHPTFSTSADVPGFPVLDPNNPMAAIMAMQAIGFPPLPGFPSVSTQSSVPSQGHGAKAFPDSSLKKNMRCRDYDTKGFCAAGSLCPYEHGMDHIVMGMTGNEYDPRSPSETAPSRPGAFPRVKPQHDIDMDRSEVGRGRARGRNHQVNSRQRGGRASFSSAGPNHDRTITSIVVEQIPEDKFSEEAVREFFSDFGTIDNVDLQSYKRLAVVRYSDWVSAKRAYDSPKVIFDNRFVKVYWYKPNTQIDATPPPAGNPSKVLQNEETVDLVAIQKRQDEAQKAHKEKAKKIQETEFARLELEQRIKAQAEERKKLMEKLARRSGATSSTVPDSNSNHWTSNEASDKVATSNQSRQSPSQTEALRLKLAELEAEAETLGINPDDSINQGSISSMVGRGRGRGRGTFPGRGRGQRGGAFTGSVARLDNRPKSVAVTITEESAKFEPGSKADEGLRSFLFGISDSASVSTPKLDNQTPLPPTTKYTQTESNTRIVTFRERYVAENFIRSAIPGIPGIGKVELAWIPTNMSNIPVDSSTKQGLIGDLPMTGGLGEADGSHVVKADEEMGVEDRDYDVADDGDGDWAR